MKIKDLFEGYLSYCAAFGGFTNMGNTKKTLFTKRFFLLGPIMKSVGEKPVSRITEFDFVAVRDAGAAHGIYGSQRSVMYFKQLLEYAESRKSQRVLFNYKKIKIPSVPIKKIEYLTPDELSRVRNAFNLGSLAGLRSRALIEFMMGTALRIGEVRSITKASFDLVSGKFRFIDKFKNEQEMTCPENSLYWVKFYLSKRNDNDPHLFSSGKNGLNLKTSGGYIREQVRKLNIAKKVAHHIIRKTCATHLLLDTDIKSAQVFLRHKNPETTLNHYTAITEMQTNESTARRYTNNYVVCPA